MLRSWNWMGLWRTTRLSRLTHTHTHTHRCPFHYRGLECKSRKSRNTWGNMQIWPWNTEWSRAKANREFSWYFFFFFCQENGRVIANILFQQHKIRLHTWTSPDGQYRNQVDYIPYSQRWRSSIHLAKTRPGANCFSDHQILIAKFRLKLKKVGEIHETIQVWPKLNPFWLYSGCDK